MKQKKKRDDFNIYSYNDYKIFINPACECFDVNSKGYSEYE